MKSFMTHSDELMNDFDKQYFDKHVSNPTFAFWKQCIDMVSTLLLFINMEAQLINEQFEVIVSDCDDFPASSYYNSMIDNLSTSHEEVDTNIA